MPLSSCFCQLERSGARPFPFSWLCFRGRREGYATAPPPSPCTRTLKKETPPLLALGSAAHAWTPYSSAAADADLNPLAESPSTTASSHLDPAKNLPASRCSLSHLCQPTSLLA